MTIAVASNAHAKPEWNMTKMSTRPRTEWNQHFKILPEGNASWSTTTKLIIWKREKLSDEWARIDEVLITGSASDAMDVAVEIVREYEHGIRGIISGEKFGF